MPDNFKIALDDAPTIHIDENNEVHVVDGQAIFANDNRTITVDRVMSIHHLRVYVERGRRALDEWESRRH